MSSILDFLNIISTGHYGRDVRQAIVDAINQCYEDGVAGVTDLEARQLIEAVMAVNEEQEAEIDTLQARVAELEGGSSSSSTTDTTTTDVPTLNIDTGTVQTDVNGSSTKQVAVTFNKTFATTPTVICLKQFREGVNNYYSQFICAPIRSTITTTGFTIGMGNKYSSRISPTVLWIAFETTTTTINTDITVPATDDLTDEQIAALIALLD